MDNQNKKNSLLRFPQPTTRPYTHYPFL